MESIARMHRGVHAISLFIAGIPDVDVDQAEAHILAHLHAVGPSRIGDIHAAFGHRRSTLTSVLDRLEKRKFIKRAMDANDRRSIRISLTSAGKNAAALVYRALSTAESRLLKRFSAAEIEAFGRIADALADIESSR